MMLLPQLSLRQQPPTLRGSRTGVRVLSVLFVCLLFSTGFAAPLLEEIQSYLNQPSAQRSNDSTIAHHLLDLLSDRGLDECPPECTVQTDEAELVRLYELRTNFRTRCLTLGRMELPVNGTNRTQSVHVGIGDQHCTMLEFDRSRCFTQTISQCEWQYAARDLGPQHFPRFILEVQCSGCPASPSAYQNSGERRTCLARHNQCEYTPEEVTFQVLKRNRRCDDNGAEVWEVTLITDTITVGCSCTVAL